MSLFKIIPQDSEHRLRLVAKFIENDYEKVDRLLEMRENYEAKVSIVDREIKARKQVCITSTLSLFTFSPVYNYHSLVTLITNVGTRRR